MRIDKLQVYNFRRFSDTEIVLNGKDAIFYGVNGMGKSSILDVCNLLFSRIMQEAAQDEQIKASLLGEKDVKVGEKETKIDVNIIVEYGSRIPDVAFDIQNRVKTAVEGMTGLKVVAVNVHVQGVNTEAATEEKEDNTENEVKE